MANNTVWGSRNLEPESAAAPKWASGSRGMNDGPVPYPPVDVVLVGIRKLLEGAPGEVRACYEAGPTGYGLYRQVRDLVRARNALISQFGQRRGTALSPAATGTADHSGRASQAVKTCSAGSSDGASRCRSTIEFN